MKNISFISIGVKTMKRTEVSEDVLAKISEWKDKRYVFKKDLPLASDIEEQMSKAGLITSDLDILALKTHLSSLNYLKAILFYENRVNLNNSFDSPITRVDKITACYLMNRESFDDSNNSLSAAIRSTNMRVRLKVRNFADLISIDTTNHQSIFLEINTPTGKVDALVSATNFREAQIAYTKNKANSIYVTGFLDMENKFIIPFNPYEYVMMTAKLIKNISHCS